MALTNQQFLAALQNGKLEPSADAVDQSPPGVILSGLVRQSDSDQAVQFSPNADCDTWYEIPIDLIFEVEPLGKVPGDGQEIDHVLIQLTEPATPEARLLTDLLRFTSDLVDELINSEDSRISDFEGNIDEPKTEPNSGSGTSASASDFSASFGLAGFSVPRFRPPRVVIPPVVPRQITRQITRVSRFSKCAKCKLATEVALAAIVAAAFAAAGTTGPGAIAAVKLALAKKFGEAAASAALGAAISRNNSRAAEIICRVRGDC